MNSWLKISGIFLVLIWHAQISEAQQKHWVKLITKEIIITEDTHQLDLVFEVEEGIHIQADEVNDPNLIPTQLKIDWPDSFQPGSMEFSASKSFNMVGEEKPLQVFSERFTVKFNLVDLPNGSFEIPGELYYQACNAFQCFFPRILKFAIKVVKK